uniref:Uncharacterized protein n=1 Tax=Spongospora subterranea TaxID=70186 RepID=A0A0H5RCA9_9EUKA|eukprot:CRZ11237.1 hypothetical protein [Spongospora subterranea]
MPDNADDDEQHYSAHFIKQQLQINTLRLLLSRQVQVEECLNSEKLKLEQSLSLIGTLTDELISCSVLSSTQKRIVQLIKSSTLGHPIGFDDNIYSTDPGERSPVRSSVISSRRRTLNEPNYQMEISSAGRGSSLLIPNPPIERSSSSGRNSVFEQVPHPIDHIATKGSTEVIPRIMSQSASTLNTFSQSSSVQSPSKRPSLKEPDKLSTENLMKNKTRSCSRIDYPENQLSKIPLRGAPTRSLSVMAPIDEPPRYITTEMGQHLAQKALERIQRRKSTRTATSLPVNVQFTI